MSISLSVNMETFTLDVGGVRLVATDFHAAMAAFDIIQRLKNERDDLDAWADAMLAHLGRFPRMPSCANGTRRPATPSPTTETTEKDE